MRTDAVRQATTPHAATATRPTAAVRSATSSQASGSVPTDSVATGAMSQASTNPLIRVDRLIRDLRSGNVRYAPEIAAKTRPTELTASNFPCQKYVVHAGAQPLDARKLPTEIVPKGSESRYRDAVTVDSKLTAKETRRDLETRVDRVHDQANELARQKTESVMFWVEGDNADGKDGTLGHLFSLNPLTTTGVKAFKAPSAEEKQHEPNWRVMQSLAGPGQIGFHNRTAYGDVAFATKDEASRAQRLADIKELEYGLTMGLPMTPEGHIALPDANGLVDPSALQRPPMRFIKILLNVSKPEQAARLAERLMNNEKADKISPADLEGHARHDEVQTAFANAFAATSTPWAPSYIIPHDNKETGWRKMAEIVDEVLEDMNPQRPGTTMSMAERQALAAPLLEEAAKARRS